MSWAFNQILPLRHKSALRCITVISYLSCTAQTDLITEVSVNNTKREGEKDSKRKTHVSQSCDHKRPLTSDKLSHFCVWSLPKQANQGRDSTGVPHADFVVIRGFSEHKVSQSSACVPLNFKGFVVKQIHQVPDAPQPTYLLCEHRSVRFNVCKSVCEFSAQKQSWKHAATHKRSLEECWCVCVDIPLL